MNSPKQQLIFSLIACVLAGCGVKGDPLPPEKPAELGRGRPTYKRATENIKIDPARPNVGRDKIQRGDEDEDEE